jgi:hypothetical protein
MEAEVAGSLDDLATDIAAGLARDRRYREEAEADYQARLAAKAAALAAAAERTGAEMAPGWLS